MTPLLSLLIIAAGIVAGAGNAPIKIPALILLGVVAVRTWSYGRHLGRIGFEPSRSLYGPAGAAVFLLLLLNSIRAYLWAGSVNWKGRSYNVQRARNIAR
ncbi:MAG: hypothetical protein DMG22_08680 [Acidobacteria bacterium]|nr:MAG: hypothetical protein DMG22_08680 [Acidobacteriota bacterium]